MSNNWDRRMAVAARKQELADADVAAQKLAAFGVPAGLHDDDRTVLSALLRMAENRPSGFSTTLLARTGTDADFQTIRLSVLTTDDGPTIVTGGDEIVLDPLTGLPGRDHLLRSIEDALQASLGADHLVGVFFIDIDRFKTINDAHGLSVGDTALREVAGLLREALRPDDVLTRLGGDEFTVVVPDVLGPAEAMDIAEQLREVSEQIDADSPAHGTSMSIGVAVGGAERSAEELLRASETALYRAKGLGRDRSELFDDALRNAAERRITVDQRLRHALDTESIIVNYQPIVEVGSRKIVGAEALLRIVGVDGNPIDPRELVEAAEDGGLIGRIETMLLERATTAVRALPATSSGEPIFLSVNVSDNRLSDSRFPLELAKSLHAADLPADRLHLELNRTLLDNTGAATRLVKQLRTLGVHVSIDEFAGQTEHPLLDGDLVGIAKLDKKLITGIHSERGRTRFELAATGLAEAGLDVCAVGVETEDDFSVVDEVGCRYAQGYLFSPPVDAERLAALVEQTQF